MKYFPVLLILLAGLSYFSSISALADGAQPAAAVPQARAIPNFENGQLTGYKTYQPQQGETNQKLGLKNEDRLPSRQNQDQ